MPYEDQNHMKSRPSITELETQLQELDISTEYIDVANTLAYTLFVRHQETERAIALAMETQTLCIDQFSTYKKGLAESLINQAFYQTIEPNLPEALRLILKARKICDQVEDSSVLFRQFIVLRFIYALMEDYSSALAVNIDHIKLAQELKNPLEELKGTEAMVFDSYRVNEHEQALAYSEKAHALAERLDNKSMHAHVHMNRTYPLRKLGQHELALENALKAYEYYQGLATRTESINLGILGYIYLEIKEYEKAMSYFQQELAIVEKLDSEYLRAYSHCEIGMVHLATDQIEEALHWLKSGIQMAETHDCKDILLDNYPHLVKALKADQNFEQALAIFEKLATLRAEVNDFAAVNHRNAMLVIHETEQAQLEAKLQQERADRHRANAKNLAYQNALFQKLDTLKNELVATASHDIRNPLTAMQLDIDLLSMLTGGNQQAQKYVKRLEQNVAHMTHLINDLLDFSQLHQQTKPILKRTNLSQLIEETLTRFASFRKTKNLLVQTNFPDEPIYLAVDAHQMERVFDNLISNAIKYSAEGGAILVSLAMTEREATFVISDTGRGIPVAEIPHIFDRGFRASNSDGQKGEGNGLAIVKQIVKNHQGEIFCTSVAGQGSTFTMRLKRGIE